MYDGIQCIVQLCVKDLIIVEWYGITHSEIMCS